MSQTSQCPDCGEEIAISQLISGTHRCNPMKGMDEDALVPRKYIERPAATKCWHCRYHNGGRFVICPLCGKDQGVEFYRDDTGHLDSGRVA